MDQRIENLNNQLLEKVTDVNDLLNEKKELEMMNARKMEVLMKLKNDLIIEGDNEDVLFVRNRALRDKLNNVDASTKLEGERILSETKKFFKKLGIKVYFTKHPEGLDNLLELKIQFTENKDYSATFYYDSNTEDYDLIGLSPNHPRFKDIRHMLRTTGDIQGFLYNYRNKMLRE